MEWDESPSASSSVCRPPPLPLPQPSRHGAARHPERILYHSHSSHSDSGISLNSSRTRILCWLPCA